MQLMTSLGADDKTPNAVNACLITDSLDFEFPVPLYYLYTTILYHSYCCT